MWAARIAISVIAGLAACGGASPTTAPVAIQPIERTITSGDVRLYVRITGPAEGPVMLMIHGGPGFSHDYLVGVEPLVPSGMRVVSYDQRGGNRSSKASSFAMADVLGDIDAIRRELGVERLHILGHSWGGFLALAYALEHSDRVASLMLVGSMPPANDLVEAGVKHRDEVISRRIEEKIIPADEPPPNGDDCSAGLALVAPAYFANPRDPSIRTLRAGCSIAASAAAALAESYDFRPSMTKLTMPVMVMTGAQDPFGLEWADALVAGFTATRARRVIIPACGHFPWLEAPGVFRQQVASFLAAPKE